MSQLTGPVIVVDDDDAVRNSLKFALELEGLSVRLFKNGIDLLAEPDLPRDGCYVIDYNMPGMTGIELVGRLRQRQIDSPAILIASQVNEELYGRAARSGFRRVLEKPLHDSDLLDSIHAALS
ncbi:FixJ family two-component response regulator [Microvirga flocculans]|uniref:FixJ family two-component response regulator n=1 Tax=Microvirga flocculans TaxID=217168 RepID=A0A7W6NA71_9HYPH|nr:response regulator [Microvirga flocculans]MBB4042213.1 FixJ family two-component response regulator [Microvirga flocculans]